MRKALLILFALAALAVPTMATDIVVSSVQTGQIPFQPTNLGNARTFTVTATNGSATVTSAAAFPTNIVGKSGFTITIGSVYYTVAAVASTSSLTLTTAFAETTDSYTLTLFPYTLFRAYPTQGFQTSIATQTSVTVSATNGSQTVTSSAAFNPMYIGVAGGFQVLIGSVPYRVLWVASTSSLTLATAFAGTSGSTTMTFDGIQENVQAATPGSGNWYKEVAVSLVNVGVGNTLYYPSFVLPATTNALINNQARFVFNFYRPDNSLLGNYACGSSSQLAISYLSTPTTLANICTFNVPGGNPPPNTGVYSTGQIDQRFPSCTAGQSYYFAANGNAVACLNFGSGLTLTGNTLTSSGGGSCTGGVSGTFTYDPASLTNGQIEATTYTLSGVMTSNAVFLAFTTPLPAGMFFGEPQVIAADTIRVNLINQSGSTQDLSSGTLTLSTGCAGGGGGSGTVSSVGLSMPSILTVSGSPVTTSGTLTATLATQSANRIFAGPTSGGAATPTFRAMVAADLPNTAVTAGSYTCSSITVDAQGRLTAASTGSCGAGSGTVTSVSFTSGLISVANPTTAAALTVAGTSGGIPYFSSSSTWASSLLLTANALMIGGGAGAAPATTTTGTGVLTALGVNVGSAGAFVVNGGVLGTPSSGTLTNATGLPPTTGIVGWPANASGVLTNNGSGTLTWTAAGGGGTVTSVAQSFTGGLISVAGSPITTSGTLALTVAGTSGGIPYFSSSTAWASSAVLTANLPVIGGGAGVAPTVGTVQGNTTKFTTYAGSAPATNDCAKFDANGNITTAGAACGSGGGTIGGSGTANTLAMFTASTTVGDSFLSQTASPNTVTNSGRESITGLTINTDATNTVASLTSAATFTKNDTNSRVFDVVRVKPTFNFGGSNANTTVNLLAVDSTNTAVTGTIFNLLSLSYGGTLKFSVDSAGAITFASGVRQAFAPSTTVASLNVGQVGSDPSSPVNGDVVYNTGSGKFRCYQASAWADCIGSGGGGAAWDTITDPTTTNQSLNMSTFLTTWTANTAITNTVNTLLTLAHNTSGTPLAGFGTRLLFKGESSSAVNRDMAAIDVTWLTATDASRTSALQMYAVDSASSLTKSFQFGIYPGASTYSMMWVGNVTPSTTNSILAGNGSDTFVGGTSSVKLRISNGDVITATTTTINLDASAYIIPSSSAQIAWSGGPGLVRPSANVLRITDSTTGAGQVLIGTSSDTVGAQFDVRSQSASVAVANFSSAASPSAAIATFQINGTTAVSVTKDGEVKLRSVAFASLPTVANGALIYCSDCNIASPCTSGGGGALAKGIAGAWVCN